MARVMYDAKTRDRIRSWIMKLEKKGLSNKEIAKKLNDKGFTSPEGGEVTPNLVASQKTCIQKKNGGGGGRSVDREDDSGIIMDLILNAPNLSDSKKIQLIRDLNGTPL